MKIITWNCRKGKLQEKYKLIQRLRPDILVVQEADEADLPGMTGRVWIPPSSKNKHHGLAIYTFNQFSLQKINNWTNHWGLYLPVKICKDKKHICNVVGYWTKPKKVGETDYMSGFIEAMTKYSNFIKSKPTIVAGDLNCLHGLGDYPEILSITERLGLISAYYEYKKIEIGSERYVSESSYYHYCNKPTDKHGKPFLLDHIFIPLIWRRRLKLVQIGTKAIDIAREENNSVRSDHRPVIAKIDLTFDLDNDVL